MRHHAAANRATSRPPRADIEGLRAVAVLTVLAFHSSIPFLSGGFVGVDVFFVISGYLITGLLLREIDRTGTVSLADFYARRARRILPAAGVTLFVVSVLCWVILPPLRRLDVARDIVAAALQVANWRFVAGQVDYLAAGRVESPVLHYWSLGVEEQFYLLWPPLLVALAWLAPRTRADRRVVIAVALTVLTAGSLWYCVRLTADVAPMAYMGSPSRAWQFGAGGLLALAETSLAARSRTSAGPVLRGLAGWAGSVLVIWSVVALSAADAYPGLLAVMPTLGTVLVLAGGTGGRQPSAWHVGHVLATSPMRAVGRLSFAWYLWHWPALVLAAEVYGPLSWPVKSAVALASALPAMATMWLVERPIRFSPVVSRRPRTGLSVGFAAAVVPLVAAMLVGSSSLRDAGVTDLRGSSAPASFDLSRTSGPVVPDPFAARRDLPPHPAECIVAPTVTRSPSCLVGGLGNPHRVVLFGDSHAAQWYSPVKAVAAKYRASLEVLTKAGCPAPAITVDNRQLGRAFTECDDWRQATIARIASERPQLIVVSSLNRYPVDAAELARGWRTTLTALHATGSKVVLLHDSPFPDQDMPVCMSAALQDWPKCSFNRDSSLWKDPSFHDVMAGAVEGVHGIDLTAAICPVDARANCPAVIGGVMVYRDDSHVTDTFAGLLTPQFEARFRTLGLVPFDR